MRRSTESERPRLSVVITTRNLFHLTWHLIDSIHRTADRRDLELLVVDNGSTDETPSLAPFVDRFLINPQPGNLARSINLGVGASVGEVIYILNNDVVCATAGWLEIFTELFARPEHDVVMPLMVEGLAPAPALYPLAREIDRVNRRGRLVTRRVRTHLEMACTAIRRSVFALCGGFDETMPSWYHHQDFFIRLLRHGVPIHRSYNVLVRHLGNSTIGYGTDERIDGRLRREYETFLAKYAGEDLSPWGLAIPAFGPYDLVPGAETVITTDGLDLGKLLAVYSTEG